MKWLPGQSDVVGLALGDREVIAVQLARGGKQPRVTAMMRMPWDPAGDPADAEVFGKRLQSALREAGITGRRVVVGLPARWVMARLQTTPPIHGEALSQTLRLMADRLFSADANDLAVDYVSPRIETRADRPDSNAIDTAAPTEADVGQQVLLLATAQRRMQLVQAVAAAAGLAIEAVMPTVLALAAEPSGKNGQCVALCGDDAIDIVFRRGHDISMLRHVPLPSLAKHVPQDGETADSSELTTDVAAALQRALATEHSHDGSDAMTIELWGHADTVAVVQDALAALKIDAKAQGRPEVLAAVAPGAVPTGDQGLMQLAGGAVALGLAGVDDQRRVADLAHSKLTPVTPSRFSKPWRIASLLAAAAVLIVGMLYMQLLDAQQQHDDLAYQLNSMRDDVESAETQLAQMAYVEKWFAARPVPLEFLREMTLAFPERGVIWSTEVSLRDQTTASITGGAEESRHVLELRDRLEESALLENVNLQYLRESGRQGNEVSFAMSMTLRKPSRVADAVHGDAGPLAKREGTQKGADQ